MFPFTGEIRTEERKYACTGECLVSVDPGRELFVASQALADLVALLRLQRDAQPIDILEYRKQFDALAESASAPSGFRVEAVDAGRCAADRLTLLDDTDGGVLLYLHGGAYVVGSPRSHRELAARIGRAAGCSVLVPEYRLAPEHPFPAALDDAVAAYRWLVAQGTPPERIVVGGDSAGGGLAAAAVLALRVAGEPLPGALVLLSPWTDLAATGESLTTRRDLDPMVDPDRICESAQMYLGGADPKTPLASPLYGNLTGFPPTLIHVGTAEVLHDDATRFAARLREAGADVTLEVYEDMFHVWHFFAGWLPEGEEAISQIGTFVRKRNQERHLLGL